MVELEIHAVDLSRLNAVRWNRVRWTIGVLAAALWIVAVVASPASNAMLRLLYMLGLLATELFGALSATLVLKRTSAPLLTRITDWGAFVVSVMVWFIALFTDLWAGMTAAEGIVLALTVGAAFAWLVLAAISKPRG
jgi:hypothetical protein